MKNDAHDVPQVQLSYDNRTLIIRDVGIAIDGVYMCVAVNRAGNYSTSATIEILGECAIMYFLEANATCLCTFRLCIYGPCLRGPGMLRK